MRAKQEPSIGVISKRPMGNFFPSAAKTSPARKRFLSPSLLDWSVIQGGATLRSVGTNEKGVEGGEGGKTISK